MASRCCLRVSVAVGGTDVGLGGSVGVLVEVGVAVAVSALVGDQFLYTTGNYMDVDGGFHIKRL